MKKHQFPKLEFLTDLAWGFWRVSDLVLHEAGRVLQHQVLFADWVVPCCQRQAPQRIPSCPVFADHRHELLFNTWRQQNLITAHTDMCTPVNHSFWSTLHKTKTVNEYILPCNHTNRAGFAPALNTQRPRSVQTEGKLIIDQLSYSHDPYFTCPAQNVCWNNTATQPEWKDIKAGCSGYLDKHLANGGAGFVGGAVHRHGLPVPWELQCELFLHQLLNYLRKRHKHYMLLTKLITIKTRN